MRDDRAIELEQVTKVYPGAIRALDAVSLAVAEGEHCCLLGPNGAGKTTIMRLLQGALQPTAGVIRVLGVEARGQALVEVKRRMGIVPQNPGLYTDLTVREYLGFVRALYGRGAVEEMADAYSLAGYLDRPLATLSGGYQRRLLVVAAVLGETDLLLLDEPTVGLDPLAAADTRRLLRSAMRGRTVLMSTHNLAEAEELCDTVIIVREGRVLIHERIAALRRQMEPRVHLVARQEKKAIGEALDSLDLEWSPDGEGVWLHIAEPDRFMPAVLRRLLNDGIDVYECSVVPPTLEDLFVDVVTRT